MRIRVLVLAMLICAAVPMAAEARGRVVVDADMSFDDAATLAYLAQADRRGLIDLDAVTVSLSGAAYTGRGLSHARCLVRKHGLRGVPVSDGSRLGANPLPEAIRSRHRLRADHGRVRRSAQGEQHDRGHGDGGHDPLGSQRAGVHASGPHVLVGPARRGRRDHRPFRHL